MGSDQLAEDWGKERERGKEGGGEGERGMQTVSCQLSLAPPAPSWWSLLEQL